MEQKSSLKEGGLLEDFLTKIPKAFLDPPILILPIIVTYISLS
jgi:hypothetical protein